ncbi:hypothetical protein HYR54_11185 [Candidatus Acetothermia bacterium]|nr:hypothetical protein [Candidatus Acetothermia bacterium]
MLNNQTLRRMVAAVVFTAMVFGAAAGLLAAAGEKVNSKQAGETLATYFKIGNRPTAITAEEVEKRIANFPDFGEKTITIMKGSAPIDSVAKLDNLKNSKGKSLLNVKQLVLLLTFYNLKP